MPLEIKGHEFTVIHDETPPGQKAFSLYIDVSPSERIYFDDFIIPRDLEFDDASIATAVANRKAEIMAALRKLAPMLLKEISQ